MRRVCAWLAVVTVVLGFVLPASEGASNYDDIPLPAKWIKVTPPPPDVPSNVAVFSGGWRGEWRPGPACYVIVTRIYPRDRHGRYPVEAIYTWGSVNIHSVWVEQPGFIFPGGNIGELERIGRTQLVLEHSRLTLAFHVTGPDELQGRWGTFRSPFHYGTFQRAATP